MSTRSIIAIQHPDQRYHAVYCHFDGYDHDNGVGPTLRNTFNSHEKVQALIDLGDLSSITGEVVAYHRDRGDPWERVKPQVLDNLATLIDFSHELDAHYLYRFESGQWLSQKI